MIDGLLPAPHNDAILDLVFVMGCWHAYAKLRLHTEHTLTSFEQLTADLGVLLRHFTMVTCPAFNTVELPRESAARLRRTANNPGARASGSGGARLKTFNLNTYKIHALGDYPQTIRERGTTDNYTSQRVGRRVGRFGNRPSLIPLSMKVELEHRTSKSKYAFINKHNPERDIGTLHRRIEVLQELANSRKLSPAPDVEAHQDPDEWKKMSQDSGDPVSLAEFITAPRGAAPDPAKKVCTPIDPVTQGSMHHKGLCGKPSKPCPTVDVKPVDASRS